MDRKYINGVSLGIGYVNWLFRWSRILHKVKLIYLLLQGAEKKRFPLLLQQMLQEGLIARELRVGEEFVGRVA